MLPKVFIYFILSLSSGLGTGYIKYAPGTFGTLLAALIIIVFNYSFSLSLLLLMTFLSIIICSIADTIYDEQDSKKITLDEIIGFFVSMYGIPISFQNIFICFILFRLFDIFKPFPISFIDSRYKNGFGIVADDIIAGIFTNIIFIIGTYFLSTL